MYKFIAKTQYTRISLGYVNGTRRGYSIVSTLDLNKTTTKTIDQQVNATHKHCVGGNILKNCNQ